MVPVSSQPCSDVRRPGRPRDVGADEVILKAANEVLAETGVAGFSVDAVAHRAGVGKAKIYRRWSSRAELLLESTHVAAVELPDPDTGSVREDLVELLQALACKMRTTSAGPITAAAVAEAAINPEMRDVWARFTDERRQRAHKAITRGIERGELPLDTDPDLVMDMLCGPIFARYLVSCCPVEGDEVPRFVDVVLAGVSAVG